MARIAPITFEQRLARIHQKASGGTSAYQTNPYQRANLVRMTRKKRRVHLDMLVFGAMVGGTIGMLFAMKVGLFLVTSIDVATLYQMMIEDYFTAVLIAGVAIAPIGFILSQIFARSNPRGWQFWIGYFAAVLGTNAGDIQAYFHMLTGTAG